jgi:hypothetical protein
MLCFVDGILGACEVDGSVICLVRTSQVWNVLGTCTEYMVIYKGSTWCALIICMRGSTHMWRTLGLSMDRLTCEPDPIHPMQVLVALPTHVF